MSSLIVHLVVWMVDLSYWTIKFRMKINKLIVQYSSITRWNYILSVPHEVSKSETERFLRTVCFVSRFLFLVYKSRHL